MKIIKNTEGEILYVGGRESVKSVVGKAVSSGVGLQRASLKRSDLSGARLSGADLEGADLRGSNLVGANLDGANLKGVDLTGAVLTGASAIMADFSGAIVEGSVFDSAVLTSASMDYCRIGKNSKGTAASFVRAKCTGVSFKEASINGADFRNAKLGRAAFQRSTVIKCRFDGASFRTSGASVGGVDPYVHLPDRTRGALVAECSYKDADLGPLVPAMRWDRKIGKAWSHVRTLTSASGAVGVAAATAIWIPDLLSLETVSQEFGTAGAVALVTYGIINYGFDKIKEATGSAALGKIDSLYAKCRKVAHRMSMTISDSAEMAACIYSGRDVSFAKNAFAAADDSERKKGFWSKTASFAFGKSRVFVCSKRTMDLTLEILATASKSGKGFSEDITIVRMDCGNGMDDSVPQALRIGRDGTLSAVWKTEGSPSIRALFGSDGNLVRLWREGKNDFSCPKTSDEVLSSFTDCVHKEVGLPKLRHDPRTHRMEYGRDGTVLIYNRSSGRLDNDADFAAAVPGMNPKRFRNGMEIPEEKAEMDAVALSI